MQVPTSALCALVRGVDTAEFSFAVEVSKATGERLTHEREQAQEAKQERNAAYCSEWLDARVYPHGANGFAFLLAHAGEWAVKVQRGNRHRPGVFVEMRSHALHAHPGGPLGACAAAADWVRETLFADALPAVREQVRLGREKLSRLDLHLDYQGGWQPTLDEAERRLFIRPARASWHPHMAGEVCTGYSIGKRRVMARLYNKTVEARHRHNEEYFALLEQAAGATYDPAVDVWRVEFELRREGMRGFALATPQEAGDLEDEVEAELEAEDLPSLGTLGQALRHASPLWRYLTTRWLRLVAPDGEDANRARWPTHPAWEAIQAGFDTYAGTGDLDAVACALVRERRYSGYRRLIDRLATAIAETAALLVDDDPAAAVPEFLAYLERLARQAAEYQRERRRRGRARLDDARQERYLAHLEQLAHMAGGIFARAGVLRAELPPVADMTGLLLFLADELDEIAAYRDRGL